MSELVGNPEDRFSHNETQMTGARINAGMSLRAATVLIVGGYGSDIIFCLRGLGLGSNPR